MSHAAANSSQLKKPSEYRDLMPSDADAGLGAAYRDGFQLRQHRRHHAVCQSRVDQILVACHAFDVDPGVRGIDLDDMIEITQIEAPLGALVTGAEQG